jgi:hypothetical protein
MGDDMNNDQLYFYNRGFNDCLAKCLDTPPTKTLTDEVVNKLWAESSEDGIAMQQGFTTQQHYFAHLLLRKAQEK